MIFGKIKTAVLLTAAALAVSFGVGWGFSHLVNRAARKEAQRRQKEAAALQTLIGHREQTQKEVDHARKTLASTDPDAWCDSLFP